jgi:hypothetical protein
MREVEGRGVVGEKLRDGEAAEHTKPMNDDKNVAARPNDN